MHSTNFRDAVKSSSVTDKSILTSHFRGGTENATIFRESVKTSSVTDQSILTWLKQVTEARPAKTMSFLAKRSDIVLFECTSPKLSM